jgi:Putative prokaryotic signal transducing protein
LRLGWVKRAAFWTQHEPGPRVSPMREVLRSNDAVRLSWLTALLADAGIAAVVFDDHMSIVEGSIGALPRRLMVEDADHAHALRVLAEAGEKLDHGGG